MKKEFTKKEMIKRRGCYTEEHLMSLSFMKMELINIDDILNSEIPLDDKAWFLISKCDLSLLQKKEFAIGCAMCVLPIFESKNPEISSPREAIEAAKSYLRNEIGINELNIKIGASRAYKSQAEIAVLNAAIASSMSAICEAYVYASYAASYYAAVDSGIRYKKKLIDFIKNFVKEN